MHNACGCNDSQVEPNTTNRNIKKNSTGSNDPLTPQNEPIETDEGGSQNHYYKYQKHCSGDQKHAGNLQKS